jgi:hypothetical protein
VGSKDDAVAVANKIEDELHDILLDPEGDALISDIKFTEHVMGRFDVSGWDRPSVVQLFRTGITGGRKAKEALLVQRYGTFYTGTQESDPLSR